MSMSVFFLVEEQSDGASKAVEAGAGDLSKPNCTSIFFWCKVNVCNVQFLRFVVLKKFWSCSIPYFSHIGLVM